jgi:energy-coupling factor transporter ATP-binding protein EcfA2
MKIKRISTNGFRGLPDRTFDFTAPRTGLPAELVVVTGPSGSGKSSLLDAILAAKEDVGSYGLQVSPASFVRTGDSAAKVQVEWILTADECARNGATGPELASESIFAPNLFSSMDHEPALVGLLSEYDPDPAMSKVEYFHSTRRIPRTNVPGIATIGSPEGERLVRLTRDDSKYAQVIQYVAEAGLGLHDVGQKSGAERLAKAFSSLCRTRQLAGIEKAGRALIPRFADARGNVVGPDELSDSERQALLFAVTFLRAGVENSLVLIDTPELHLPEAEVGSFVRALMSLGTGNQLIIATGSLAACAANPDAAIITMG